MRAASSLHLGQAARVTDALTGEAMAHENGTLKMDTPSWRYRVLRVAPK